MEKIMELVELLFILAIFLGATFAMAWGLIHGEWILFFAAAATCYSMESHIDKL